MLVRRRAICESTEDEVRGMTEEFVQVAMETAAHHARRIARTLRLGGEDVADLRQEVLVEVLRRAVVFDRERAAWTTFVTMIIRHAAADLADRFACLQRQAGGSLEDWVRTRDGARVRRGDVLSEANGLGALWSGHRDPYAEIEQRIDVQRFVDSLPDSLKRLCRLLQDEPPAEAQRLSGLSKSDFYRQLDELAMRLRAVGLGEGVPRGKNRHLDRYIRKRTTPLPRWREPPPKRIANDRHCPDRPTARFQRCFYLLATTTGTPAALRRACFLPLARRRGAGNQPDLFLRSPRVRPHAEHQPVPRAGAQASRRRRQQGSADGRGWSRPSRPAPARSSTVQLHRVV